MSHDSGEHLEETPPKRHQCTVIRHKQEVIKELIELSNQAGLLSIDDEHAVDLVGLAIMFDQSKDLVDVASVLYADLKRQFDAVPDVELRATRKEGPMQGPPDGAYADGTKFKIVIPENMPPEVREAAIRQLIAQRDSGNEFNQSEVPLHDE